MGKKKKKITIQDIIWARDILKLEEETSRNETIAAYRQLSLKNHPDKCGKRRKAACEKRMQELNLAYKIMLDYCDNCTLSLTEEGLRKQIVDPMARFYGDWMWGNGNGK